jgi:carbamate kinase
MTEHCPKPLTDIAFTFVGEGRNNVANSLLGTNHHHRRSCQSGQWRRLHLHRRLGLQRRYVPPRGPSPKPKRIFEIRAIRSLVEQGTVVICAGGGGIPTTYDENGLLHGVEAVIDKDLASALLAEQLGADLLVIATDVDVVYTDWGSPNQTRLGSVTPDELAGLNLPAASMGPEAQAAGEFARNTGNEAVIGALTEIVDIADGKTECECGPTNL